MYKLQPDSVTVLLRHLSIMGNLRQIVMVLFYEFWYHCYGVPIKKDVRRTELSVSVNMLKFAGQYQKN